MGEIELSSVKKMQDLSNMEGDMRAEESEVVSKMNLSPEKNKKSQEETKESSKKPKNKKLEQQEVSKTISTIISKTFKISQKVSNYPRASNSLKFPSEIIQHPFCSPARSKTNLKPLRIPGHYSRRR
jgi:hypothetical protein